MVRDGWLIVVGALLGGGAVGAEALPNHVASVRLLYQRDASAGRCPDEAALRAAVSRRLGFDPFDGAAARVISCRVRKVGGTLRARIDVAEEADGTGRELVTREEDCQELAQAIELALGIAINPITTAARNPAEPPTEPVDRPEEAAPRQPAEARADPAPAATVLSGPTVSEGKRTFELRLGARADMAVGIDPGFAYGGALALGLRRRGLSGTIELRLLAPSSVEVGRGTFHAWQWAVLFAPCAHRGGLAGCLLGSAGMMYGRGEGFAINGRSSSPTAAVGARGAWEYPLLGESLRLVVNLDLVASVTRTHFTLGTSEAWSTPPLGTSFGIGAQGAFF